MKRFLHVCWLAPLLLVTGVAMAGDRLPQTQHKPLRPVSKCLDAGNINELHMIDDTTLIARNGPRYYLVKTAHKCPKLGIHGRSVFFHASNGQMGEFRICGDVGETVASIGQPPCAVKSVKKISKKAFDKLAKQAEKHTH